MIRLLLDKAGSGKTKKMIDMANNEIGNLKGELVYIDKDNRHIHDLHRSIRLIPANEYEIGSLGNFSGFLRGVISQDYDIERIYIDDLNKIVGESCSNLEPCFEELNKISQKYEIDIIISATLENETDASKFSHYSLLGARPAVTV